MVETYVNRQELINGLKKENLNLKIYIAKQSEQAKKIIKEFMRISVASVEEYEPEFSELIARAEQFIKE